MATVTREFEVPLPAAAVWAKLRDFTGLQDLAGGFVTACVGEEDGAVRRVTFFNGMEVRERLVTLDEDARRIVYTAVGGRAFHHNASAQVLELGGQRCRFVWTTDLLPDALAPAIAAMMDRGAQAMQATLTPPAR
jgi:carbon monoxide dehydrogenase subunit G